MSLGRGRARREQETFAREREASLRGRIDPFTQRLEGEGGILETQQGIADQFGQIAQGEDPLLAMQRERALGQTQGQLSRTGVTGSAALNQLGRVGQGFEERALAGRNQALQSQAGVLGDIGTTAAILPALDIGAVSAANAGKQAKK